MGHILILAWMYSTSELDELFQILNSVKGFKLNNHTGATQQYSRIPVDYAPTQDLSIDIKMMPQGFGGYHSLLVISCDQTNFTIAVPLRDRQTQTVAEALIY